MTRLRALIVDDSENERRLIQGFLDRRGMSYDNAADPAGAREKMLNGPYDIVFLDLDLGGGIQDGEGLLSWMERHNKQYATIIISEAAASPQAIRLSYNYRKFVAMRIAHKDVPELGTEIGRLMNGSVSGDVTYPPKPPSTPAEPVPPGDDSEIQVATRVCVAVATVGLAIVCAYAALYLLEKFSTFPNQANLAFAFVMFAGVCGLAYVVKETALRAAERIVSRVLKQFGKSA